MLCEPNATRDRPESVSPQMPAETRNRSQTKRETSGEKQNLPFFLLPTSCRAHCEMTSILHDFSSRNPQRPHSGSERSDPGRKLQIVTTISE